jgi:hypothetical protein
VEKGKPMKTRPVVVARHVVAETIEELRQGGHARTERFVLWLARKTDSHLLIHEFYVPQYEASSDYFHIGRPAMARLMEHLRTRELMIGAQLHTHPQEAFHSLADDRWAIVRHVGALSIVLPDFGRTITVENLFSEGKVFTLSPSNNWAEIPRHDLHNHLRITA